MDIMPTTGGWIEVICGSMFSGKSEELIRRLRRAQIAKQKTQVFKAGIDTRYDQTAIVSHNTTRLDGVPVADSAALLLALVPDTQVIGIDEVQFFDADLPRVCNELADQGKRVICAGLDQDFRGAPFGPIPELLAIAEYITKTMAVCMMCGQPGTRTQRLQPTGEIVQVGAAEAYEARCRRCHSVSV